jgi:hypothetical protein
VASEEAELRRTQTVQLDLDVLVLALGATSLLSIGVVVTVPSLASDGQLRGVGAAIAWAALLLYVASQAVLLFSGQRL